MDTFMDKLAQRLTAQEIIRANSEADAEEIDRLKTEIEGYKECLEKVQNLADQSTTKIDETASKIDNSIERLNQNTAMLKSCKPNSIDEEKLNDILNQYKDEIVSQFREQIRLQIQALAQNQAQNRNESNEQYQAQTELLENLQSALDEKLLNMQQNMDNLKTFVTSKMENSNESVHKECVKVYRNVQAVVVDENDKQTDSLRSSFNKVQSKISLATGLATGALIASCAGVIFQILVYLKVI